MGIPGQERSVDPYASYNSDVVNKLTRIISNGNNCLLEVDPINVTIVTGGQSIVVSSGKSIVQDVLIETEAITIDVTDSTNYVTGSTKIWEETGYYYVVLEYEYEKISPPPTASIKIISHSDKTTLYDSDKHLFLKCLVVTGSYEVTSLLDYDYDDESITRNIAGGGSGGGVAVYS